MISYVEREERNPTLDTLLRMTVALELDLGALIKQAILVNGALPANVQQE